MHLHRWLQSSLSASCVCVSHIHWAAGQWFPHQKTHRTYSPHSTLEENTGRQKNVDNHAFYQRKKYKLKTAENPSPILCDTGDGHFNFPAGGDTTRLLACYLVSWVCGGQPFWQCLWRALSATCSQHIVARGIKLKAPSLRGKISHLVCSV